MILWLSGTVGSTTLSVGQMPSHHHDVRCHNVANGPGPLYVFDITQTYTDPTLESGGSQSHIHSLSNASVSNSNILPPYYVLSYIMRIM